MKLIDNFSVPNIVALIAASYITTDGESFVGNHQPEF